MNRLHKVALITGGGRGIGRSIALAFAKKGYRVTVAAEVALEVEKTANACRDVGVDSLGLTVDIREEAEVREMVDATLERFGSLDILITSAGIIDMSPIPDTTLKSWENTMAVNLTGTFLSVREGVKEMTRKGWGRIICLSSLAGRTGSLYNAAYSASKHGVLGLVRSVALEVAGAGVTVNAICPGFVETTMAEEVRPVEAGLLEIDEKDLIRERLRTIPIGRFLTPDEIAPLALFLASDDASTITGQAIGVDGGVFPA